MGETEGVTGMESGEKDAGGNRGDRSDGGTIGERGGVTGAKRGGEE